MRIKFSNRSKKTTACNLSFSHDKQLFYIGIDVIAKYIWLFTHCKLNDLSRYSHSRHTSYSADIKQTQSNDDDDSPAIIFAYWINISIECE